MTEFAKTCKRIEEIANRLIVIEQDAFAAIHQTEVDHFATELQGSIAERILKFKARIVEPDPKKRIYGSTMEAKVKACIANYDDLLQKFARVYQQVAVNHGIFAAEKSKHEEEERHKLHQEEVARKLQQQEEEREKQEAEQLRILQLREAVLHQQAEHREMFSRRQDWERAACIQKEAEERSEIEARFRREVQKTEECIELRRKKEEARDEKRRRLGTILEQHRQVKEKGEQQLIAEAIALSLRETAEPQVQAAEPAATPSPAEDSEAPQTKDEADVPPAADLETEEVLIKQAIELSLQLSTTPIASHCQSNNRMDKTPDAQSP